MAWLVSPLEWRWCHLVQSSNRHPRDPTRVGMAYDQWIAMTTMTTYGFVWTCWVYSQWNSHLIGIMISKTIGFRGTLFSDTPIWLLWPCHEYFQSSRAFFKLPAGHSKHGSRASKRLQNYGKSTFFIFHYKWQFSIAMSVYRRVRVYVLFGFKLSQKSEVNLSNWAAQNVEVTSMPRHTDASVDPAEFHTWADCGHYGKVTDRFFTQGPKGLKSLQQNPARWKNLPRDIQQIF